MDQDREKGQHTPLQPSLGGRPSVEESEERLAKAASLYLRGVTNGSKIAAELGVSAQTGANLIGKIRERLAIPIRGSLYFDEVRSLAIDRANDLLAESWRTLDSCTSAVEKNAVLKNCI